MRSRLPSATPQDYSPLVTHYHVYLAYGRRGRMFCTDRRYRFESKSRAHAFARQMRPDKDRRFVQACSREGADCPAPDVVPIRERRSDR